MFFISGSQNPNHALFVLDTQTYPLITYLGIFWAAYLFLLSYKILNTLELLLTSTSILLVR